MIKKKEYVKTLTMKIRLTPNAVKQIKLFRQSMGKMTGFIIGVDFGHFRIIEQLLPIGFDETTIDQIYTTVYNEMGDKLLGTFFGGFKPFNSDWFLETVILTINENSLDFFLYDFKESFLPLEYEEQS